MQLNRGLVFWGVALITAGAVALAIQARAIDAAAARDLWRLWPVVLIVIGLSVIAARTPFGMVATVGAALVVGGLGGTLVGGFPEGMSLGCSGEPDETLTADGTFGESAEVVLDLDCGELSVTTVAGSEWALEARHASDAAPDVETDGDALSVESEGAAVFAFADARQSWDVSLPTEPTVDLDVNANAATSRLDLADGTYSRLAVDANAGDVTISLPGATVEGLSVEANAGSISIEADDASDVAGTVSMNAGSLELCVPDGVSLAITIADANVTFSHNLEERGLTQDGETWRTGDGDAAITLDVEGNAASFTLNPEEGCS